ncbi:MAG: YcxB family protein [Clostridia bacterium]|nr:YcxB family protein [Clostridia bacterium]
MKKSDILFKNRTTTSEESLRRVEKYAKPYMRYVSYVIKISCCIFIIFISMLMLLREREITPIIYIALAIWGIKDTISLIFQKVKVQEITYEFYTSYFIAKTEESSLKIGYDQIKKVEEDEINYYIIFHTRCGVFLDKNCFSIGDEKRYKTIYTRKN